MKSAIAVSIMVGLGVAAQVPAHSRGLPAQTEFRHPTKPILPQTTSKQKAPKPTFEFIENKGQWDSHVRFLGRSPGVDMWITDTGITYHYSKGNAPDPSPKRRVRPGGLAESMQILAEARRHHPGTSQLLRINDLLQAEDAKKPSASKSNGQVIRISFVGAGTQTRTFVSGKNKKPYYYNYLQSSDRSKWATHVPVYSSVDVKDLYKGVDLVAYFDPIKKRPRYDLVVQPGADASQIAMRYDGADRLRVTDKGLVAYNTCLGRVEERDLFAYQPQPTCDIAKTRTKIATDRNSADIVPVAAKRRMAADGTVRFALGATNRQRATVIDPLIWATFLDGTVDDYLADAKVAPDGSTYILGSTTSPDFPTTTGATVDGSGWCPFLTHLSADGSTLLYGTVLPNVASLNCLAVQSDGTIVIAGYSTGSYPTTVGALKTDNPTGDELGVITKLSSDGASMLYSTYVGEPIPDEWTYVQLLDLTTDASGSVYVTGNAAANGLATPGSPYPDSGTGVCFKLSPNLSSIVWGTYMPDCYPYLIGLDASNNIYVTGGAGLTMPTTPGAFQTTCPTDGSVFVTKLHPGGSSYDYSTYLDGSSTGYASSVSTLFVDAGGSAFVGGNTSNSDFPVSPSAIFPTLPGDNSGFMTKLSPDGGSLAFSTYFGNHYGSEIRGLAADSSGTVYFTGTAQNQHDALSKIPTTPGVEQSDPPGEISMFAGKLTADGSHLSYCSYFGGSGYDFVSGLSLLADGSVVLYGQTSSVDFPTTLGSFQPLWQNSGRNGDIFVARALLVASPTLVIPTAGIQHGGKGTGTVSIPDSSATPTVVNLASASPLVRVPRLVTIPAGDTSVDFPVKVYGVDTTTVVTVRATFPSTTVEKLIQIDRASPVSFTLTPTSVTGGTLVQGTIAMDGLVGGMARQFTVSFSDPNVATDPGPIYINNGQSVAKFSILPKAITSTQSTIVYVHDENGNEVGEQTLTVSPVELTKISMNSGTTYTGYDLLGKITLSGKPGQGLIVALSVDDWRNVFIPDHVTMSPGQTSMPFLASIYDGFSGPAKTVHITATYNGKSVTFPLVLKPITITGFTLSPNSVASGYPVNVTVSLSAPTGNHGLFFVDSTSSDSSVLEIPRFTMPNGAQTYTFPLSVPLSYSGPSKTVTLTVSHVDNSRTALLKVNPLKLAAATIAPTQVHGGGTATLTLDLSAITKVDTEITLSSDSGAVGVPSTVTIPAGSQSVTVPLTTHTVTVNTTARITASFNGVSKVARLTVSR